MRDPADPGRLVKPATPVAPSTVLRRLTRFPLGLLGGVLAGATLAAAVLAPVLAPAAPTAVFLASDAAAYYTGQVLGPNGGDVMP